jgi:hypothetical protein
LQWELGSGSAEDGDVLEELLTSLGAGGWNTDYYQ